MIYQNHQRIIFCNNPWIRFKARFTADEAVFWVCTVGGVLALFLPWGGQ